MRASTTLMTLAAATAAAGRTEQVTVSDFSLHMLQSPASTNVLKVSFKITSDNAQDVLCTRESPEFPAPHSEFYACDESNYSFTLWEAENGVNDFALMIYHDVGDSHADLRGWLDVATRCTSNDGGPEDWTCTQLGSATLDIGGPVGDSPGDEM